MFNKESAIAHLNAHAGDHSLGRCAQFVREAIAAGGVNLHQTRHAKDYGASLGLAGFIQVYAGTLPQAGDVAVIQAIPGHPSGHMAMYNGSIWVSDFKQHHGYYPSSAYRDLQPAVVFYRKLGD